ncbi:hypothetical protein [Aureimonas pseudogalii]|uniref:Chemotaxis protein MotC n=1 Tax=Aureimonas pseudogalii TaxID=1744844 RepID=A0A7W6E7X6_9HYPH|nr:hypothetical protein [Aureimonas pseudogalii]MBB3996396.1 chemotaxis protein MotC [Aureimonas pseudogalii]
MRRAAGWTLGVLMLGQALALPVPALAEAAEAETAASSADHGAAAAPGAAEGEAPATGAAHGQAAATGAALATAPFDPSWKTSRTPMPFDVMRSVQFLQDQVARGNDRAIRVQALLLRRFGPTFLEADPVVWKDPRNVRAVILFTLSGGSSEVIDRLAGESLLDETQTALVQGASAYVRNDLETAAKRLLEVDLASLEPVLAAQLSLVLGQILQIDHPADALPHLDRARLLAPGTLIEEAALRLEATLVEAQGERTFADRLARQYFDRYADSSYAGNFEARFAAIYVGRAKTDPGAAMAAMADVLAGLPDPRQARLFLSASRRSLVEGNLKFANDAAQKGLSLEGVAEADRVRGRLYEVASRLGTTDPAGARSELEAIDAAQLHPEDAKLLDAAFGVLDSIDAHPLVAAADPVAAPSTPEAPSVLSRAEQALAQASQDLIASKP